jgi:hypothetical protein
METRHITIGPEFFAKAPLDYSNPTFALIREFVQNCVDAPGCRNITITSDNDSLTVSNDGAPMTAAILTDVFLSLGGTSKDAGSVGGFGKAKELLCFCHNSYKIESGDLTVYGSGASYKITRGTWFNGTRTTICLNESVFPNIESNVRLLASQMNWSGTLSYNGVVLPTSLNARTKKAIGGLGKVKVLKGGSSVIVRAGGVPMFSLHGEDGLTVILDLIGDTKTLLTSNRDGLRYRYSQFLSEFVKSLSTNKRKALEEHVVEYIEYGSSTLTVSAKREEVERKQGPVSMAALAVAEATEQVSGPTFGLSSQGEAVFSKSETTMEVMEVKFTIRNETGMKLDRSYFPDTFGKRSKKLLEEWTKAIVKAHEILGVSDSFAVGFVFSEDASALYECRGGVKTYYVNPVSVEKCGTFRTMRFKKLDKHDLLSYATHEVLHGIGYDYHDENFAAAFTYAMAKVLRSK